MSLLSFISNRYLYLFPVLMMYTSSTAQSSSKNYVQTMTYLDSGGTTFLRLIDYFDELGYVEQNANGTPTSWNYYVTDHLGSTRMVVGSDNSIKETINYYPFGSEMRMEDPALLTGGTSHPFRFTGKELDKVNSLNMYDFGARWYDVAGVPMWTSVDPLSEKYYNVSPYAYCAGDPVNRIDFDGNDWYQNDEFHYYIWFDGDGDRYGFTHIGGKNSLLGEFEPKINNILIDVYESEMGLYSDGRTINITNPNKGAIVPSNFYKMDDFLDEFVFGYGPEISILKHDHPYIKTLQTDEIVLQAQHQLRSGETDIPEQITGVKRDWGVWDLISTPSMAKQFVGSYSFDSYTSNDGKHLLNIIYDTKNFRSLAYHIWGSNYLNHSRNSSVKPLSTTYQFYIWKSKK